MQNGLVKREKKKYIIEIIKQKNNGYNLIKELKKERDFAKTFKNLQSVCKDFG